MSNHGYISTSANSHPILNTSVTTVANTNLPNYITTTKLCSANSLDVRIHKAENGLIVEFTTLNPSNYQSHSKFYIVNNTEEVGKTLEQMIALHLLSRTN